MTLYIAVVAMMPSASESTASVVKPGVRRNGPNAEANVLTQLAQPHQHDAAFGLRRFDVTRFDPDRLALPPPFAYGGSSR